MALQPPGNSLVSYGANLGICSDDILVLKGSEHCVYIFGHAGHKSSQLGTFTAQALVSSHKVIAIAKFHEMLLLGKCMKSVLPDRGL